jgi:hypothetical protein
MQMWLTVIPDLWPFTRNRLYAYLLDVNLNCFVVQLTG